MRPYLLAILFTFGISFGSRAQYVPIPDPTFGDWLYNNGHDLCMTGSSATGWQFDTTCAVVASDTFIDLSSIGVSSIEGIQYIRNLRGLNCQRNNLSALPDLPVGLTSLNVFGNSFITLPALPAGLTFLDCSQNALLTSITSIPSTVDTLYCWNCHLSTLPTLPPVLSLLYCSGNVLTANFAILPASLENLTCSGCGLTGLPALPAGLKHLDCVGNYFTAGLPALPSSLEYLSCTNSNLHSLPTLPNSLTFLDCGSNQMTSLPALSPHLNYLNVSSLYSITAIPTLPASLRSFSCNMDGSLTAGLPALPDSLTYLSCVYCNLSGAMPHLPDSLQTLYAAHNYITSVSDFPPSLQAIGLSNNLLTSIPRLHYAANYAYNFAFNDLASIPNIPAPANMYDNTDLNITDNPRLTCLPFIPDYTNIQFDNTAVSCIPNRYPNYNPTFSSHWSQDSLPVCGPTSACPYFNNIWGNIHQDTLNSCLGDSLNNGPVLGGIKMLLSSGGQVVKQTYSTHSGQYTFQTDSFGTYTVSVDTALLPFSVACPGVLSRTAVVDYYDSVFVSQDFGLKCKDIDNGVTSIYGRFRRGAHSTVQILAGDMARNYGSVCPNHSSGTVTLTISGPAHYTGPATGALTPSSISGNVLSYSIADFGALSSSAFSVDVVTDSFSTYSTACITVEIATNAAADQNAGNDQYTQCFPVVSSLDPNEKDGPRTSTNPGDWVTYTIHFQNTGTDTAYSVVVTDTLDANIDPVSFQQLASGSPVHVDVVGNLVTFTFANINLPDSGTNQALSSSWVQYKVRTTQSAAYGTRIYNTAAIVFDFNVPVLTNTAVTRIQSCADVADTIQAGICPGGSYTYGSNTWTVPGTYSDTVMLAGGCDSVTVIVLNYFPVYSDTIRRTICSGSFYQFDFQSVNTAGTYQNVYTSVSGCDSAVNLILTVNPPITDTSRVTICHGATYNFDGTLITDAGSYQNYYTTASGCDSISDLEVSLLPYAHKAISKRICNGSSYHFGSRTLTTAGTYTDTLSNGCDTIRTLSLSFVANYRDTSVAGGCTGTSYHFGSRTLTTSGTYSDTVTAVGGCDSILTIRLTFHPATIDTITLVHCANDSVTFAGTTYGSNVNVTHTFASMYGCDSTVTLRLTFHPISRYTLLQSICPGDSVTFDGKVYKQGGYYNDTLTNIYSCDSIRTLFLDVRAIANSGITAGICSGDSFLFGGQAYYTAGSYAQVLTGVNGCDSILSLQLTVYQQSRDTITSSICTGDSVVFGGVTRRSSGYYTLRYTSSKGCDSTITMHLSVNAITHDSITQTICNGDSVVFGSVALYNDGYYTVHYNSSAGCDSAITLQLIVRLVSRDTLDQSICRGDSVTFGGVAHYTSGYYTLRYNVGTGCDSTVTLHLTVNGQRFDTLSQSICTGDSVIFAGTAYYNSGYYSILYNSSTGCDSTSTLHLTVNAVTVATISQSICAGDSVVFGPAVRRAAGSYTVLFTSSHGCDSTVTLQLSVRPVSHDTISQTICGGDSVVLGSTAHYASGYYSQVYTGVNGCDSTITLHLTVKALARDTMTRNICQGDSFTFAGTTYRASGYYSAVYNGSNGCDSISTLHLRVNLPATDTFARSICAGESVSYGGQSRSTPGYYAATFTTVNGCDSVSVMHLSVNTLPVVTLTWDSLIAHHYLSTQGGWCPLFFSSTIPLTGGTPAGGTYTGRYVQLNIINFPGNFVLPDTISYTYTDAHGCRATAQNQIINTFCDGVSDVSPAQISLYPNPNNGSFTLVTEQLNGETYVVYDMLGQIITEQPITADTQRIELGDAAPGVYSLAIKGRSGSVRFTVIR